MKVLIVCSKNSGKIAPFILDQTESLKVAGIEIDFFTVSRKGLFGYLKSRKGLLLKIKKNQPNLTYVILHNNFQGYIMHK